MAPRLRNTSPWSSPLHARQRWDGKKGNAMLQDADRVCPFAHTSLRATTLSQNHEGRWPLGLGHSLRMQVVWTDVHAQLLLQKSHLCPLMAAHSQPHGTAGFQSPGTLSGEEWGQGVHGSCISPVPISWDGHRLHLHNLGSAKLCCPLRTTALRRNPYHSFGINKAIN